MRVAAYIIRLFISLFGVDMSIAREPDPNAYTCFNDFFTRTLHDRARPVASEPRDIASPVDGAISQLGHIHHEQLFQAKGHYYNLKDILGGSVEHTQAFNNGAFITIYLSPKDYHRIHMPLEGTLREMIYIPGRLFSVNPRTTRVIPGLFARNERIVSLFDTGNGPMAVILIGAIFVGSMETVWSGMLRHKHITKYDYREEPVERTRLQRGQEMGRFNMGSTVIVLFAEERMTWNELLSPGTEVMMGQAIGRTLK